MEGTTPKRPSERAAEFLNNFLRNQPPTGELLLPSTRFIAGKLGISEGTVRNVLRRMKKEGAFEPGGKGLPFHVPQRISIGTNAGILDPTRLSGYPGKVLLSAFRTVLQLGTAASISSIFSQEEYDSPPSDSEVARRCNELDAILISQSAPHPETLIAHCNRQKKPYIVLNSPGEEATTNFVSPNQTQAFYQLGKALARAGRRRLALLVFPSLEHSAAIRQRVAGLVNGLGPALGERVQLRIGPCQGLLQNDGRAAMETLLQSGYFPDAILTAGDHLALGAMEALERHGVNIPSDVSVITGGGVEATVLHNNLTRLSLPAHEVGQQAVEMLVTMVRSQTHSVPGRYIDIPIFAGRTTTPEENRLLQPCFEEANAAPSRAFS